MFCFNKMKVKTQKQEVWPPLYFLLNVLHFNIPQRSRVTSKVVWSESSEVIFLLCPSFLWRFIAKHNTLTMDLVSTESRPVLQLTFKFALTKT